MAIALARASPISRGSIHEPPASGMSPTRENGLDELGAARRQHDVAGKRQIGAPAPAATPLTAQTMGFSSVRMRRISGL